MGPNRPTNDTDRRILVKQILRTARQDRHALELIPDHHLKLFRPIVQDFCKAISQTQTRQAVYRGTVATKNRALRTLAQYSLHFMNALKRRARREGYPVDVLQHYYLRSRRQTPHNHESRQWLVIAEDLIRGDIWARQYGYRPIAEPTAEALSAKLVLAQRACNAFFNAERELLIAQRSLKSLRRRIDLKIKFMLQILKHFLVEKGNRKPGIRRNLVRYGYVYPPRQEPDRPNEKYLRKHGLFLNTS